MHAPVHESVAIDEAEVAALYQAVAQSVHLGAAVVVPAVSVNLPAAHLGCSAGAVPRTAQEGRVWADEGGCSAVSVVGWVDGWSHL